MEENEFAQKFRLPCRYLRNKEMYYQAESDDAYASGAHWCVRTQEPFGPDGEPANRARCCEGRSCFLV